MLKDPKGAIASNCDKLLAVGRVAEESRSGRVLVKLLAHTV